MEFPNWFAQYADRYFAAWLTPMAGQANLRFLQIGAYTGDATVWLFENILTDPTSHLVDVDTWEGSNEIAHESLDFGEVERTYNERTRDWQRSGQLVKFKGMSGDYFLRTPRRPQFDFIYVDGDHTAVGVLEDAVAAFPRLKVGGLLGFDDYLWHSGTGFLTEPAPAIDVMIYLYSDRLQTLERGLQVWMRRTR